MSDWLLKKLLGQDLMDKAWDLVVAEENARIIVDALRPELQDIEEAQIASREAEIAEERANAARMEALALAEAGREEEAIIAAQRAAELAARAAELARAPVLIKAEGFTGTDGTSTGIRLLQSRRYEESNKTIAGVHKFMSVEGTGRITDIYIVHASSSTFNVELVIDGDKWYADSYTNLAINSVADSYLAAYQDAVTNYYVVKFSGISFINSFEVIVSARNLTFETLRANYDLEVRLT